MNRFRKAWSVMLGAALLLSALPAHADPYWQMHWEPGRYTVAMTAEQEAQITRLTEETIRNSEGTPVRTDADQESVEAQYERYISLFPDGSPVEYSETEYEDIGHYRWAAGLPDDQCISREEAWKITPVCFDDEESGLPVTAWQVAVYVHDGSICGYREVSGAG